MTATTPSPDGASDRRGLILGLGAYFLWGVAPFYFKALEGVRPLEVLCHRVIWTVILLFFVLLAKGEMSKLLALAKTPEILKKLAFTGLLISGNWLTYIYAISVHELTQASLGYFLNPLLTVALGAIVLKEKMKPLQWVGLGLALVGVCWRLVTVSGFPWIALTLAMSFAIYGLIRKTTPQASPIIGLSLETLCLLPLSLVALLWMSSKAPLAISTASPVEWGLLAFAGPITALPLLLFAAAAQRIPLSTLGFLQYLAPSLQFSIAVFVFKEPMDNHKLLAFVWVWVGLIFFLMEAFRPNKKAQILA